MGSKEEVSDKEKKEPSKNTVKTRGSQEEMELKKARNDGSQLIGEQIKEMELAEELNSQEQTVKNGQSRLTSKARKSPGESAPKEESTTEEPKSKTKKKLLMKPMIYDYKKMNPQKIDVKEAKILVDPDTSAQSLIGSPSHLTSATSESGTSTSGTSCDCSLTDSSTKSLNSGSIKSGTSMKVERPKPKRLRSFRKHPPTSAKSSTSNRPAPDAPQMTVTISSVMAGFQPFKLQILADSTVRQLKNGVKAKTKAKKFFLSFNGKELQPEDSLLSSHGVVDGSFVSVQVKSYAGTNNREELAALMRLAKPLADFKNLLDAAATMPVAEEEKEQKAIEWKKDPAEKAAEEKARGTELNKTKDKMKALKRKLHERSADKTPDLSFHLPPKRVFGRKSENESNASSSGSVWTDLSYYSDCSDTEREANKYKVTANEAALYFDVFESQEAKKVRDCELFDVPENVEQWEVVKEEFSSKRCGYCLQKLKLAQREMKCRCDRAYCKTHRAPDAHKCGVDLKEVDRRKLDTDQKRGMKPPPTSASNAPLAPKSKSDTHR